MRTKFSSIITVATVSALSMVSLPLSAAPISGLENLYTAVQTACTPPAGSPAACEAAMNNYAAAIALELASRNPRITVAQARLSFTALQQEVEAAGGGAIASFLFEDLLETTFSVDDASPV